MRFRLDLVLQQGDGALMRALGTIERRGFVTCGVDAAPPAADGRWPVTLLVDGERTVDGLCLQLRKLYDVVSVAGADAVPAHAASATGGMDDGVDDGVDDGDAMPQQMAAMVQPLPMHAVAP